MHNSGKMPDDKRERLERLGFVWCGQEAKRIREQAEGKTVSSWDDRFRSLMEFREVHGHSCVPMQRHDPGNIPPPCQCHGLDGTEISTDCNQNPYGGPKGR